MYGTAALDAGSRMTALPLAEVHLRAVRTIATMAGNDDVAASPSQQHQPPPDRLFAIILYTP